jgi:hypothetical protein
VDLVAEVLGDIDDRLAGDPVEDRLREPGRVQFAVPDQKDILAGPSATLPSLLRTIAST